MVLNGVFIVYCRGSLKFYTTVRSYALREAFRSSEVEKPATRRNEVGQGNRRRLYEGELRICTHKVLLDLSTRGEPNGGE